MKKLKLSRQGYKLFRLNGEATKNILQRSGFSENELRILINDYYDYIDTSGRFFDEGAVFRLNDDGLILLENYKLQKRDRIVRFFTVCISLAALFVSIATLIFK